MADNKKGFFGRFKDRLGRELLDLYEDSVEEFADESESLEKSEDPYFDVANKPRSERYKYKRASLIDPSLSPALGEAGYGVYKPRYSHITNKTLKEMSLRDSVVASIIQTRINQVSRFAKPQESRFEPGFKIVPKDKSQEINPGSEEEQEIEFLKEYICNTGSNENRHPDSKMDFNTFMKLVIRDRLTFGAAAIETIRDNMGRIHSFIPAPTESIYYANKQANTDIIEETVQANQLAYKQAVGMNEEDEIDNRRESRFDDDEEIEFVQVINGRVHEGFTRKDMVYKLGNPQNFITNNGYCFVPKTARVQLGNGSVKFVEDVQVGDEVIDHKGGHSRVVELKSRKYSGEVVELVSRGLDPIKVTPEHPVLVISHHQKITPHWKPAKDIKVGEYLCIPKVKCEERDFEFDISKHWIRKSKNYVSKIALDEDLAWALGVYAGDGCIQKEGGLYKHINFDIGAHEDWIIERLRSTFESYNATVKVYSIGNYVRVTVYSSGLASFFAEIAPGTAHTKTVPNCIFEARKSIKRAFIEGWIDADGNHNSKSSSGVSTIKGATVSEELAYGITELSNSCGFLAKVKSSVCSSPYSKKGVCEHFVVSWRNNVTGKEFVKGEKFIDSSRNGIENDDYFFTRISTVSRTQYTGMVFNFEVEDSHSYTSNLVVSHNCISELEFATMTITTHLQAENYNKMFFTHGFAARGLLHIQGDVTPANLKAFRSQWYAQVSGNANSWRTPIIAGVDKVDWIPLSASNRDMEYTQYIDHIIRTLCAIFAISPIEIGFDYLTKAPGQGGIGTEDNDSKLQQSQVRGLKPLLTWIEGLVNEDILPNVDEDLALKYKFEFVGLEAESKMEELERQQQEAQVRATLNEIREESGLDPILGGEVVSNPAWIDFVFRTHTVGQIREYLFGYEGDAENPKYDYIPDGMWFEQRNIVDPELAAQQQQMAMMSAQEGFPQEEGGAEEGQEGSPGPQGEEPMMRSVDSSKKRYYGSLMKSNPFKREKAAKKVDQDLERVRKQYIQDWKAIEKMMMKDIFEAVKEDLDVEDTE